MRLECLENLTRVSVDVLACRAILRYASIVSEAPDKKKDVKVHVLRCRSETCRALLPFEETDEGLLLGNMIEIATRDGQAMFFPCPRCGGRNHVEEVVHDGKKRTRVTGFTSH